MIFIYVLIILWCLFSYTIALLTIATTKFKIQPIDIITTILFPSTSNIHAQIN